MTLFYCRLADELGFLFGSACHKGAFFTSRRGASAILNWQKPASLVVPTPALHPISVRRQSRQRLSEFFLAAQRRTASAVKKKLPKENPWKGFSLDSFPNRGAAALRHPGAFKWGPRPSLPLGEGGPAKRGRMRDREHSPFALQYDSAPRPSSASLRSAPSPRGRQGCVPHPTPNRGGACRAKRSPRRPAPEIRCSATRSL